MILGQGAFGRVMKAEAVGLKEGQDVTGVAVKMVKGRLNSHSRFDCLLGFY